MSDLVLSTKSKQIDMTGKQFGKWLVLGFSHTNKRGALWLCRCACGNEGIVWGPNLRRGHSTQCSQCSRCARDIGRVKATTASQVKGVWVANLIKASAKNLSHGHACGSNPTRTYKTWISMIQRCTNPKNPSYPDYGGRGITICDRWRDSFENFLADLGERPDGTTIDRIDVDGPYEKWNCRWATPSQQARNKRWHKRKKGST